MNAIVNDMLFVSRADRGLTTRRVPVNDVAKALTEVLAEAEAAEKGWCRS